MTEVGGEIIGENCDEDCMKEWDLLQGWKKGKESKDEML